MESYELLKPNQKHAVSVSCENNFQSGIHYHATGSGKSWIAMYLLREFHLRYPQKNVIWICERKDILSHQFSQKTLHARNFQSILEKFNVLDFVEHKDSKWYEALNSSMIWGKPFLTIINRCFLTSRQKYQQIKVPISLIIHDECHTIENKSSQQFYQWLTKTHPECQVIGFSATPERIYPLDNILSQYSIYDGFKDEVILPPKIIWLKCEKEVKNKHLHQLILPEIEKLPYQKIIVWCGMIQECLEVAQNFQKHYPGFKICVDFNNIQKYLSPTPETENWGTFDDFYNSTGKSLLFCAVKHREGSDIPRVDGCIFMDKVEKRSERVFIQCMGRVLRKDIEGNKKYGLIIDLKAKSTIEICNRVQYYLKLDSIFPWDYSLQKIKIDKRTYYWNQLDMVRRESKCIDEEPVHLKEYTREDIYGFFQKSIPEGIEYEERLQEEISLILEKKLFGNMVQALQILQLTESIPHVTRGSCGSSLVCYLLGISHVDPVKYDISFARFLNQYRNNLPDIDFDFPHYLRDEVFLKLFQKWGNKVARISNHNYYHEKSALREAIRRNGIRRFISKFDLEKEMRSFPPELQEKIYHTQRELEGSFKGFSLHCGGIIYYPDGIPEEDLVESNRPSILNQVNLNRDDVSENKNFKIDILSSRALSQLYYCHGFQDIDFYSHIGDKKTIKLLCSGDNIGLTLAESPLMKKALLLVQPQTILDVAVCLSIIRPAAKDARKEFELGQYRKDNIIFDDDVIQVVSQLLGCKEDLADKLRRGYTKGNPEALQILKEYGKGKSYHLRNKVKKILESLRKYGFCKAHAFSYAQLVWQLAYQKSHRPKKFWRSTLKNVDSCYRSWVHPYEARCYGVSIETKQKTKSIYSERKRQKIETITEPLLQLQKYGTWDMKDDSFFSGCYYLTSGPLHILKGLIASSRSLSYGKKRTLILLVGVGKHKYVEVIVKGNFKFNSRKVMVKAKGKKINDVYGTIECYDNQVEFI